jgi:hypothetical protein
MMAVDLECKRTKISRLNCQPTSRACFKSLERTRSNRRDMKTTLKTFLLVAGSTGAAMLKITSEYSCASKALGPGKGDCAKPQIHREKA